MKKTAKTPIIAILIFIAMIILFIFVNITVLSSDNQILVFISSLFILAVIFLILTLIHKSYQKATNKLHPFSILLIVYLILITNITLQTQLYSIEWAFLAFIVCAVIFYDFKIDSRFMILPALLLLTYIPFLLIGKYNQIAETTAIYVYYFLVVGVATQLAEHIRQKQSALDFNSTMKTIIKKAPWITIINLTGMFIIGIILLEKFYNITFLDLVFWKYTGIYLFILWLIFYSISITKSVKEL